jgi:hypothetical protein
LSAAVVDDEVEELYECDATASEQKTHVASYLTCKPFTSVEDDIQLMHSLKRVPMS